MVAVIIKASVLPKYHQQTNNTKSNRVSLTWFTNIAFLSRFGPAQAMKPKPNQQITTNPNHFPTNHQGNNIIGSYQQHRPGKQALIALKTRQVEVVLHISQTVNMHAQRNCGHGHHHGRALRIKHKSQSTPSVWEENQVPKEREIAEPMTLIS